MKYFHKKALFTSDNQRIHEIASQLSLSIKRNPKQFVRPFVIDETWIFWYAPETK